MRNLIIALFIASILLSGCATPQAQSPNSAPGASNGTPIGTPTNPPPQVYQSPNASSAPAQQPAANASPASPIPSQEISYDANGWKIYGTLYPSQSSSPTTLIVLVPGLGTTRDSYPQDFIVRLHDSFPDALVLAIDPKGVGKSTNLGSWQDFGQPQFLDMRSDVTFAMPSLLKTYPTLKVVYAIGASMGSTAAITAAAIDKSINKVVMISPGASFNGVDIMGNSGILAYPHALLVTASTGDAYSAQTAAQILAATSDVQTTLKIYPGSAHGTDMFASTESDYTPLTDEIIQFLKS